MQNRPTQFQRRHNTPEKHAPVTNEAQVIMAVCTVPMAKWLAFVARGGSRNRKARNNSAHTSKVIFRMAPYCTRRKAVRCQCQKIELADFCAGWLQNWGHYFGKGTSEMGDQMVTQMFSSHSKPLIAICSGLAEGGSCRVGG